MSKHHQYLPSDSGFAVGESFDLRSIPLERIAVERVRVSKRNHRSDQRSQANRALGASRTATDLELGVLLLIPTESSGINGLVSG